MRKQKAIYLELAIIARELAVFWQKLKGRQKSGKACSEKKGKLQVCPDWRL